MYNNESLKTAEYMNRILKDKEVVLVSDQSNSAITNLTKAQILMGYRGWLWSYGIDYGVVENDIRLIYTNHPQAESLIKKYNISYITVTMSELNEYKVDEGILRSKYPLVLSNNQYKIYKVK